MCRTSILKLSNYFCEIPQFFNQQVQLLLQQKKHLQASLVPQQFIVQVTVNNIFKDFLKIADPYESILFKTICFSVVFLKDLIFRNAFSYNLKNHF